MAISTITPELYWFSTNLKSRSGSDTAYGKAKIPAMVLVFRILFDKELGRLGADPPWLHRCHKRRLKGLTQSTTPFIDIAIPTAITERK